VTDKHANINKSSTKQQPRSSDNLGIVTSGKGLGLAAQKLLPQSISTSAASGSARTTQN